ncbi:hypothetical protein BX600DRAFT_537958 [Xylariales sp. PMI_506]|nr:hypothetical protein BX600DRAFT_537958 [Xylariales sp. PMI_506]
MANNTLTTALPTTTPGPCGSNPVCTGIGQGALTYWETQTYDTEDITGTFVVVEIINTISNTTRLSTIMDGLPVNFTPPPTNSAGTRTADISYLFNGKWLTTTVRTYPTPFLVLPDNYTITGDYELDSPSGDSRCVRHANNTYEITSNSQPHWSLDGTNWNVSAYFDPKDPLGWGYTYLGSNNKTQSTIPDLLEVLPDDDPNMPHSVVQNCSWIKMVPLPYVVSIDPNWRVIGSTSTIHEGADSVVPISSVNSVQISITPAVVSSPILTSPNTVNLGPPSETRIVITTKQESATKPDTNPTQAITPKLNSAVRPDSTAKPDSTFKPDSTIKQNPTTNQATSAKQDATLKQDTTGLGQQTTSHPTTLTSATQAPVTVSLGNTLVVWPLWAIIGICCGITLNAAM